MKIVIGIPAFNEYEVIKKVIDSIPKRIKDHELEILVVDDGSQDDTESIAKKAGVNVVRHMINRGLGGALQTIFDFARYQKVDFLITLDADGQHHGNDVIKILHPLLSNKSDVVIGSRWISRNKSPFDRYIVNQCANLLTFLLFGIWTSDSQSGFRGFNKIAINKINIIAEGMEVSSEFFKEIKRNKLRFLEVPINPVYTDYSVKKGQQMSNAPSVFLDLVLRMLK